MHVICMTKYILLQGYRGRKREHTQNKMTEFIWGKKIWEMHTYIVYLRCTDAQRKYFQMRMKLFRGCKVYKLEIRRLYYTYKNIYLI